MGQWEVVRTSGSAASFHQHTPDGPFSPTIWAHEVSGSALILGSTQPATDLNKEEIAALGWEVCRRKSGGGLVVLQPATSIWIDIFIPPSHPAWNDDIGQASWWIGHLWAATLKELDATAQPVVHEGPLLRPEEGRLFCFGGLGPGEVTIDNQKVIGVSQRRTRSGARFQTVCLLEATPPPPSQLLGHLSPALQLVIEQRSPIGWPKGRRPLVADEVVPTLAQVADGLDWAN